MWLALKHWRPITIQIVTTGHFPRRLGTFAKQARHELRFCPDNVTLEQVGPYWTRSSQGAQATATGISHYEAWDVLDPRFT